MNEQDVSLGYTPQGYSPQGYSSQPLPTTPVQKQKVLEKEHPTFLSNAKAIAGGTIDVLNSLDFGLMNTLKDAVDGNSFTPVQSFVKGITLQEKTDFGDVLTELGWEPTTTTGKVAKGVANVVGSIALSPLTYTGIGGLSKLGKTRMVIKGLSKNAKIARQGLRFIAKAEDVGKPLMKTINKVNRTLATLHPDKADELISTASKLLTPIQEAQKGYRGILRYNPPFGGGGKVLLKGERVYDKLEKAGKLARTSPLTRPIYRTFVGQGKLPKSYATADRFGNEIAGGLKLDDLRREAEIRGGEVGLKLKGGIDAFERKIFDYTAKKRIKPDQVKEIQSMASWIGRKQFFEKFPKATPEQIELAGDYIQNVMKTSDALGVDYKSWQRDYVSRIGKLTDELKSVKDKRQIKRIQTKIKKTKEFLDNSPNYVPHILSSDAMFQLQDKLGTNGAIRFLRDDKNVNMLKRKFRTSKKILDIQDIEDIVKSGKSSVTMFQPVLEKPSVLKEILGKNPKLLDSYTKASMLGEEAVNKWHQVNADKIASYWETDPVKALRIFKQRAIKSVSDKHFLDNIVETFGGTKKQWLETRQTMSGLSRVDWERVGKINTLPESIKGLFKGDKGKNIYFPKEIADVLTETLASSSKGGAEFANWFHRATNVMKSWMTVSSPSFLGRNNVSSAYMAWTRGLNDLKPVRDASRIVYLDRVKDIDGLKNMKIAGRSGEEVLQNAIKTGVWGLEARVPETATKHISALGAVHRIPDRVPLIGGTEFRKNPFSQEGAWLQTGRKIQERVENKWRLATFIDSLNKGMDYKDAAQEVFKAHYKYSDITQIEKKIADLIPFYRWMRHNIPAQIRLLAHNPKKIMGTSKLINSIQETMSDDSYVDEKLVPEWLKEQYGIQISRNDKGQAGFVALGSFLPFADLAGLPTDPQKLGDWIMQKVNPLLKTPLEQIINKDFFFKKEIEKYKGEPTSYMGIELPKRAVHIMRNIRPINELHKALFSKTTGSWLNRVTSSLIGLKRYGVDTLRQYDIDKRNINKKIGVIRSQIKYAIKENNRKRANNLRIRVRQLKRELIDLKRARARTIKGGRR